MELRVAKIRTSDRLAFKRCRRKWNWSSSLRGNLQEEESRAPLWMGTGFHYAMEDYHGYNKYGSPAGAFQAYVEAVRRTPLQRMPDNYEEVTELAIGMLDYYIEWLQNRQGLKTFVLDGKPQVEVRFEIPLPIDKSILNEWGWSAAYYQGTIDRVVIDELGRLWFLDYKTAKDFVITHLDTDPQISAYCWAGSVLYPGYEVAGFIYQQHKKRLPEGPEFLKSSRRFSTAKTQATTHRLYKTALENLYGEVSGAPQGNIDFLNYLATQETDDFDGLIRRDYEYRTLRQLESEGEQIMMEAMDMLNPELPIYKNPTRDCVWDCPFKAACIMWDDGSDWQAELDASTISRDDEDDNWRKYLP